MIRLRLTAAHSDSPLAAPSPLPDRFESLCAVAAAVLADGASALAHGVLPPFALPGVRVVDDGIAVAGERATEWPDPPSLFAFALTLLAAGRSRLPDAVDVPRLQRLSEIFAALGIRILRDGDRVEVEIIDPEDVVTLSVDDDDPELAALALLAAARRDGTTELLGGLDDQRLVPLAELLNRMGAQIVGVGTTVARIDGGHQLRGTRWSIGHDASWALFNLVISAVRGPFVVAGVPVARIVEPLRRLQRAGLVVEAVEGGLRGTCERLNAIDVVVGEHWLPWLLIALFAPGQSVLSGPVLARAEVSALVGELLRLGADVMMRDATLIVRGGRQLVPATVKAITLPTARVLYAVGRWLIPPGAAPLEILLAGDACVLVDELPAWPGASELPLTAIEDMRKPSV